MSSRRKYRNYKYLIRRLHRYLGVIIGIQFLLWTLGGLYFSWSDIDEIHGDHLIKKQLLLPGDISLAPLKGVLDEIKGAHGIDSIAGIRLIGILNEPVYQVGYFSGGAQYVQLVDGRSGNLRGPVTREEAVKIAKSYFLPEADIAKVNYIKSTGNHHEYREKPLPAWVVTYDYPGNPVIYIAAEEGTFQNIRYNNWRVFDFLWMFHTMDYEGRDRFGNILLRTFSLLALITVVSGFVLFFSSMKGKRISNTPNR